MNKIGFKEINRLAIPAIFAGVVEPLISLTDTAIAGRLPSDTQEALGAIGLVGAFLSAITWILAQTSHALAAWVAQHLGAQKIKTLRPLVAQIFYFNLGCGFLIALTAYLLGPFILSTLYGASGSLLNISLEYFEIRVWGFPITLATYTLVAIFRGYQNTLWAMQIAIAGGVANILLDIILVFGVDFHVQGIAWASFSAQCLMLLLGLYYLLNHTPFRLKFYTKIHSLFGKTLRMSGDLFLRTLALNLALFLAFRVATQMGEGENHAIVATHTLLLQVWLFSAFFLDGYAHAGAAISGKLLGQSSFQQLKWLVTDLLKVMFGLGILLALIYGIFYTQIGQLLTKNQQILDLFYATFWIVVLMQPLNAISFLFDGIYKGLGLTTPLRNVFVGAVFLAFIPSLYLFQSWNYGLSGIWYAILVWMVFRTLGLVYHFYMHYLK